MTPEKEIYKITIDPEYAENGEDLGIEQIAFVRNPAIKVKGFAFNAHRKLMFADEPKMRVTAPALIPMQIYRNDKHGEYYVEFSEEEIEKIFVKFMKNLSNSGKFNTEHNPEKEAPAYVLEAWLVADPEKDKANSIFGLEVPEGTLMMTAQITDKKYFEEIVKNEQTAFSIEGFLGMKMSEHFKKFGEQTPDNQNKYTDMKLPDGKHEIEGKIYVVEDGNVVEILEKESEMEEVKEEEVTMETVEETVEETTTEEETMEEVVEEKEEVQLQIDETELMTILQPKFDEIYKMIADLKAAMITEESEEDEEERIEMSIHQRFSNVVNNYLKK